MYIAGINAERAGVSGFKTMVGRYSHRKRERFWEIDFLRGLCVLLMVFDHFMYCLWGVMPTINQVLGTNLFAEWQSAAIRYWEWNVRVNVREIVICVFFLLCGISCTLTRGNFRRFIPLALVALGISSVTYLLDETFLDGSFIIFGVIHMISCGILMYALLDNAVSAVCALLGEGKRARTAEKILRYIPGAVGVAFLIVLFALYADIEIRNGAFTIVSTFPRSPDNAENIFRSIFLFVRGYNFTTVSADYFPILPYAAVILTGGIFGRAIYHTAAKYTFMPLDGAWNRGFCFLGRHSAFIFVAHMVVIPMLMGICGLIFKLFI